MSIRTRITLSFLGMLFSSLLFMGGVLYYELVVEPGAPFSSANYHGEPAGEAILEIIGYYGIPTALIEFVAGWWLLRRILAPIATLTRTAEEIHSGNLRSNLVPTGNGDELDRLTQVFNEMMERLNESFSHIRAFTLHASHELKTPLTIMRGELENALREQSVTQEQRELFVSQLDEIQRLTKIVDGLTLLAKADSGQLTLSREIVPLHELVQDSYTDALILGQSQEIRVDLIQCDPTEIIGDRHRLRQLLINLVENAIKYNWKGGRVTLALRRNGSSVVLEFTNTGPGVAPEAQSRVFDRFFRGDSSHNGTIEGCGLGLSIAKWIVAAHQGTIRFLSEPEKLTVVTVVLTGD